MPPRFRKFTLVAHITFSLGWLGAVLPYLALAIAGLTSGDAQIVRAAYLSMELIGWSVIVPLSLAALASGLVQSLATQWGLVRYWWILVKLILTSAAILVLLRHMEAVGRAAEATLFTADFRALQIQLLVHPSGGLLVLLLVTMLSFIKPWGMTPYGRRSVSVDHSPSRAGNVSSVREPVYTTGAPRWTRVVGVHAIGLVVLFVVLHVTRGGLPHH